VFQLVSLLVD